MDDKSIIAIHNKFADYLHLSNIFTSIFRDAGWGLINLLAILFDALEGITDEVLGLFGFFKSPMVQAFISDFKPLIVVLFAMSICFLGYQLIFNRKFERQQILMNLVVAIFLVTLLNTGTDKAAMFATDAVEVINNQGKDFSEDSLAETIMKKNVVDIATFDAIDWKEPSKGTIRFSSTATRDLSATEMIDEDFEPKVNESLSEKSQKILSSKVTSDANGKERLGEINTGFISKIFPEKYYRYKINFFAILSQYIIGSAVLLFVSYKILRIYYELATSHILAGFVAFLDFKSGQRMKVLIMDILSSIIVIPIMFLNLKVYFWWNDFIGQNTDSITIIIIASFAGMLAVMDGPNLIEKLLGVDAGVKSGWKTLVGAAAATQAGKNILQGSASLARGVASFTGKSVDMAAAGAGALGGGIAGFNAGRNSMKPSRPPSGRDSDSDKKPNQTGPGPGPATGEGQGKDNKDGPPKAKNDSRPPESTGGTNKPTEGQTPNDKANGNTKPPEPSKNEGQKKPNDGKGFDPSTSPKATSSSGSSSDPTKKTSAGAQGGQGPSAATNESNNFDSSSGSDGSSSSGDGGDFTPSNAAEQAVSDAVDNSVVDKTSSGDNRTLGQYAKDAMMKPIKRTKTYRTTKKAFEISKNTGVKQAQKKADKLARKHEK
ncbi:hypothetical protein HCA99_16725 [Listeria booriae]|uniref:pLS20_p028 family conjugation system transmembrane protein n=1 Tax=Listeria booriae TaxID=1552123 RepID=UPI00162A8280|nr:hypothetical protein [Listeria booriae]MBC2080877.1 hypothetical protein [Listeria booriae]